MAHEKPDSFVALLGEALREIGILYLVFGVLDAQIEARRTPGEPLDIAWFASVSGISAFVWLLGALAEQYRKD